MDNIYSYTYDEGKIKDELNDISYELEEEMQKPYYERDRDKEFKLIYKQFIKGLKLSTRNNF